MPVLKKEEFFAKLQERMGSDTSDEGISFFEDMTDTYNDLEKRANGDGVDWERKYKELDESWRKRYRHRFFSGNGGNIPDVVTDNNEEDDPESIEYEDLFTESKK